MALEGRRPQTSRYLIELVQLLQLVLRGGDLLGRDRLLVIEYGWDAPLLTFRVTPTVKLLQLAPFILLITVAFQGISRVLLDPHHICFLHLDCLPL